jgi:AAA15 family ATPase/GTPase
MSIKSIRIKNLLSFDDLVIKDFKDVNCIVGKNNVGKSNLLKLIKFFYNKLDGKRELPPTLNSNYSTFGTITVVYDTSRINQIVRSESNKNKSKFFQYIYSTLFNNNPDHKTFELTLQINSDDSTRWFIPNYDVLNIINYLYPFFDIETRHIDLYDWDKLWLIVSRLKSFNISNVEQKEVVDFFNEKISDESRSYKEYIYKIQNITKAGKYNYREKVLSYVKAGLKGQTFLIDDKSLETQSDGTNSHRFIEIALELLISLSRRDYISPTIYIDEPEIGLHPKKNEQLIYKLYDVYSSFKKTKELKEKGKYKTPYPKIVFVTHSPHIVKEVIKLFDKEQQILHFSKNRKENTVVQKMNSTYDDKRFLNIFSDNEARLFFSNFILFVEGETELEIFRNKYLIEKFPILKKIDVYKSSSNVFSENINPSFSNSSIPYLFLFDADKLYKFKRPTENKKKREIVFENNGNLYKLKKEIREEVKNRYYKYDKKSYYVQENLKFITDFISNYLEFDNFTFKIKIQEAYLEFILNLRDYLLSKKNICFAQTTIEESLINAKTKNMFYSWLSHEYNFDKSLYINMSDNITDEILLDYIRVFFGGKFQIQIDFSLLEKESDKTKKSKILFDKIKRNFSSIDKTSGWATSFLDFAINEIDNSLIDSEQKEQSEAFKNEFKKYFEELYDIITCIEKKL